MFMIRSCSALLLETSLRSLYLLTALVAQSGMASAGGHAVFQNGFEGKLSGLKGWQVDESNTGLAPHGLDCGSLPRYAGPQRLEFGTTIAERRVETTLDLSSGGITIERSCIRPASPSVDLVYTGCRGCLPPSAPVVIRDSEIDGSAMSLSETLAKSCAFYGVAQLERNHIHHVGSGICFVNTGTDLDAVAVQNYVHSLRAWGSPATSGSHNEAMTFRDFDASRNPARAGIVRNNHLDSRNPNDSGALFIQATWGPIDNVIVDGNYLRSSGYQLVLEAHNYGYGRKMRAIDNRFSGAHYYGSFVTTYVGRGGLSHGWETWTENHLNDPLQPENKGGVVPRP